MQFGIAILAKNIVIPANPCYNDEGGEKMDGTFEHYVRADAMHLKYAKGAPSAVGREFHEYSEFVLFLEGKARLISKNIQQTLTPGTLVIIPRGEFHQFIVTDHESYRRCIIGFEESEALQPILRDVMDEVRVLTLPSDRIASLFEELIETVCSALTEEEKQMYLASALVRLLVLCKLDTGGTVRQNINISPEVRATVEAIDQDYAKPLTVAELARRLHVSPSTLSHKFSRELNISLYRYLSKKRLAAAHERILAGETMTEAAAKSGFSNYS